MEIGIGIVIGFIVSLIYLKRDMKKSGAGRCKMCQTCDYMIDFEKRKREFFEEKPKEADIIKESG